jgi:tryptophan-rich sensory protein
MTERVGSNEGGPCVSEERSNHCLSFPFFLNILWSAIYFGLKNPLFAFIEIILLLISIIVMIKTSYKINKTSAHLLIPYLLWVGFAAILNFLSI